MILAIKKSRMRHLDLMKAINSQHFVAVFQRWGTSLVAAEMMVVMSSIVVDLGAIKDGESLLDGVAGRGA